MAVNRFMKPAEQPLLDTYVPLPFKEMSMAYASVQKEHDDAEELAGSLDDEILKVRASTPLHKKVLSEIRTNLDTELSDLVDKHSGRYADMVPELNKIKKRIDTDFMSGNLGAIKRTTKAYEKGLLEARRKAEEKGEYSSQFSPYLGAEGAWNMFYTPGRDFATGEWTFTDENTAGGYQILGDGRKVLKTYEYTGLHKGADQLKESNEMTFDKIKPDILKITTENQKTGRKWSEEQKQITLSKIYRAAHNDKDYYSDDFKKELDYIINNTSDKWILDAATSAIENIYGPKESENKTKALNELIDGNGNPTAKAKDFAKTSYVGIMGEKYLMSDIMTSDTWDAPSDGKKFSIPQSDWVPQVEGNTPLVVAGRPTTLAGDKPIYETRQPVSNYIKVVNANKDAYDAVLADYNAMKESGTMDKEYEEEWREKLNNAEYQYKSASLAVANLAQNAAKQLNAKKLDNGGVQYTTTDGTMVMIPPGDQRLVHDGWNNIQWGEDGLPLSLEDAAPDMAQFNAWDAMTGFMGGMIRTGSVVTKNPLYSKMDDIQENYGSGDGGYFGGRTQSLPTYNTTTSKIMDKSIFTNLVTTVGEEDFPFNTTSGGQTELGLPGEVTLSQLVKADIIDTDIVDNLDDYIKGALWTAVPNPNTGNYQGIINLPTKGNVSNDDNDATITLFFDAPQEVKQTWSRQGEFEYVDPSDGSVYVETRARTAPERMLFHDMFNAQLDIQRAISVPGSIAMSSYEDGEGNSLGFYYFNETPDGTPITNEQYIFQPRAGLVKAIDLETGDYIYTTGDEQFNVDSEPTELAQLISLNDPTQSASKSFWQNQVNDNESNNYPVAFEGVNLTETSEARAMDHLGNPYETTLRAGQLILPDDRLSAYDIKQYSLTKPMGVPLHPNYIGLQKPVVDIITTANEDYSINMNTFIDDELEKFLNIEDNKNLKVTLTDGQSVSAKNGLKEFDFSLVPAHGAKGEWFQTPIVSGARSYEQQKNMYDEWVAGGKKGDPVANPAVGGFHVMGQAIDLESTPGLYDWILEVPENVADLGGVKPTMHSVLQDGETKQVRGYKMSELKLNNKQVFKNFIKTSLGKLFDQLNSEKVLYTDNEGSQRSLTQFPQEWWHWSFGEFKEKKPAEFPSWAK